MLEEVAASIGCIGDAYANALPRRRSGCSKPKPSAGAAHFWRAPCVPSTTLSTSRCNGSTGTTTSALGARLPAACALRRLLPPLDPQSARDHIYPSQRISLRPTMFCATCDNSVTTSPARQLTNSKSQHPEIPAGNTDSHQTSPRQPSPLPRHRNASGSSQPITMALPSAPHPCGTGRVSPQRHSRLSDCRRQHQSASVAWPTSTLTKRPHASRPRRIPIQSDRAPMPAVCPTRQP